ncbi:glycosyltransferase [Rahnella contaminans]|uniref:glycosyltransferase n=1 Tax=Rahnella contaminans TaxID=2703882 RepID=UPI003C2E76B5
MLQTPSLSIIVAVYNGEQFLSQFFDNIIQQALTDFEMIIINDGSTDKSAEIIESYRTSFEAYKVFTIENQGVSIARNHGLSQATGQYLAFPDIDDNIHPGMYQKLLEMAEKNSLDVATCNGRYVYENSEKNKIIFPPERLSSTGVISGDVWLKQALNSRKFLHVTWLNIYNHDFIKRHHFSFEPGLRHQDIPWTTEILLAAERVQYTSDIFYDYLIHSNSVSHRTDGDVTEVRSAHHYMKILRMLDDINHRYQEKVAKIPACKWQIAKEGLGILHTVDKIKDPALKKKLVEEIFQQGVWNLMWRNANTFRLRWRLGRRYFKLRKLISG